MAAASPGVLLDGPRTQVGVRSMGSILASADSLYVTAVAVAHRRSRRRAALLQHLGPASARPPERLALSRQPQRGCNLAQSKHFLLDQKLVPLYRRTRHGRGKVSRLKSAQGGTARLVAVGGGRGQGP